MKRLRILLIGSFVFISGILGAIPSMTPVRGAARPIPLRQLWGQTTDQATAEVATEEPTSEATEVATEDTSGSGGDNTGGSIFSGIDISGLSGGPALTDTPGAAKPKASPTPKKAAPKPTATLGDTPEDTPEAPTQAPSNGNQVSVSSDNTVQNPATIDLKIGGKQKKDFSQFGCGVGYFRSIDTTDPDAVVTLEQPSPYLVIGLSVPNGVTAVLVVSDPSGQNGLCTKTTGYKSGGKTIYAAIVSFKNAADGAYQVWMGNTKAQEVQARMQAAVLDENGK